MQIVCGTRRYTVWVCLNNMQSLCLARLVLLLIFFVSVTSLKFSCLLPGVMSSVAVGNRTAKGEENNNMLTVSHKSCEGLGVLNEELVRSSTLYSKD